MSQNKKMHFGSDILLLLLYAPGRSGKVNEPIRGVTRLQKELFLAQKALKDEGVKYKYAFRPYNLGPFSKDLYRDIEWLKVENVIDEKQVYSPVAGIYRTFALTEKGCEEVSNLLRSNDFLRIFTTINKVKKEYNEMNLLQLVEFTHEVFPDYIKKTDRSE